MESPRFISTLKRALEEMFIAVDTNQSGKLTYQEFREAFGSLAYGLNDNDVNMMIALADEDENELIGWEEFIPIGIGAIKNFYTRNILKKKSGIVKHPDPEALKLVFYDEILNIYKLLSYKFNEIDSKKEGIVTLSTFKTIIR